MERSTEDGPWPRGGFLYSSQNLGSSDTPLSSVETQMLCWAQMKAQGTLRATMGGAGASARNHS